MEGQVATVNGRFHMFYLSRCSQEKRNHAMCSKRRSLIQGIDLTDMDVKELKGTPEVTLTNNFRK